MLKTYDFYDKDDNANGKGIANDFQRKGETVYDAATGLTWQQSRSDRMKFTDASKYIEQLNKKTFAGYGDWRLPTLEEAMSLLEPTLEVGLYINPIFDKTSWIWTSDKYSASRAWFVHFIYGLCGYGPIDFVVYVGYVRAVR